MNKFQEISALSQPVVAKMHVVYLDRLYFYICKLSNDYAFFVDLFAHQNNNKLLLCIYLRYLLRETPN